MDSHLRIALLLGSLIYLLIIFVLLKKKSLSVKYSIVWLFSGFAMILFAIVPYIVLVMGDIMRVSNPVNFVFMMTIGFLMLILLSVSSAVSCLAEKNKTMTQHLALLERRVRNLEDQNKL